MIFQPNQISFWKMISLRVSIKFNYDIKNVDNLRVLFTDKGPTDSIPNR